MLDPLRTSPLLSVLAIYLMVFGAVTIAGGVVGFVKAKSRASLIAGSISGALLLVAGWFATSRPALFLGLGVSAALAARFGTAFLRTKKVMPAGLIAALAVV
ncbi:MAG: TMEM14 family protein, partial [Labilithrix sp.]|nr:TMEM14 family protein [Labilithrix sp.]